MEFLSDEKKESFEKSTKKASDSIPANSQKPFTGVVRQAAIDTSIPPVIDHNGPILQNVRVEEIFWGRWWNNNMSFLTQVNSAVATIISGPYMTDLQQYRGIGRGRLGNMTMVTNPIGSSPADPPSLFKTNDVEQLISNLIGTKFVPDPQSDDQILYTIFFPMGCKNYEHPGFAGEHDFFKPSTSPPIHYAWITNDGSLNDHDSIPKAFSHELVEACTDPELNAFYHATDANGVTNEIADYANDMFATINGVTMQYYWSERERSFVLPNRFPS